jgi:glycine/D-amino acid oxidase-like deaminating enzyme
VVPAPSFVAATEPLDDTLRAQILPGKHAVSETRRNQFYYCMDGNGRFVIGGRGNLLDSAEQGDTSHVHAAASKLFPQLKDARWAFAWGGYTAMTWDKAPRLMGLDDNVYAGLGYNGRGVAMATMMGRQLALLALGEAPDMPVSDLKRIPFHAFRRAGITTRLVGGALLDRLQGVK